jgi:hypothetical protein
MPLDNWIRCHAGDLTATRKSTKGNETQDIIAWYSIYDSYITTFGLGKLYNKMLQVMKKKAILECEYVITQDRFKLTLLELEEQKLKTMLSNKGNSMSIEQSLIYLSKWLGYWVKKSEITVKEYFYLLAEHEKFNKEVNGKTNKVK